MNNMKSNYKGVKYLEKVQSSGQKRWQMRIMRLGVLKYSFHKTEKEAAKAYDIARIKNGEEPVNILKRKI